MNCPELCKNTHALPSEGLKLPFYLLVMLANTLKYIICYYITQDGYACLGTLFCPKIVPKCDLCLSGIVLTCGIETPSTPPKR